MRFLLDTGEPAASAQRIQSYNVEVKTIVKENKFMKVKPCNSISNNRGHFLAHKTKLITITTNNVKNAGYHEEPLYKKQYQLYEEENH